MYVVTGGAGFIGSNVVAELDAAGDTVAIIDWLGCDDLKWRNLAKRRLHDVVLPEDAFAFIKANWTRIDGIFHMGAISSTTERDVDAILANNFRLSVDLWRFCAEARIPFIYASSAAVYGDGSNGFDDDFSDRHLSGLKPLNPYAWSKLLFDRFVFNAVKGGGTTPPRWAGLRFFNVYGPNEYHKGGQRSVAVQIHEQIQATKSARLFRSDNPNYADGAQLRDFVWIDDCVQVAIWALKASSTVSGILNVGSGVARSFKELATLLFHEMQSPTAIEFIDLPSNLVGKYQYFTCAPLERLRLAGYAKPMTSLEDGLHKYVQSYLEMSDRFR